MAKYDFKTKEEKCIFCEIAKKNIKPLGEGLFYEDKEYMAFLSPFPNTKGFSIVIPKKHFDGDVLKMPDKELNKFILTSKKVANILLNYFEDVGRIGLIIEGTGIDHAHIKLFPMHNTPELKKGEFKQFNSSNNKYFETYEGYISSHDSLKADEKELQKLAKKLHESQNKK